MLMCDEVFIVTKWEQRSNEQLTFLDNHSFSQGAEAVGLSPSAEGVLPPAVSQPPPGDHHLYGKEHLDDDQ